MTEPYDGWQDELGGRRMRNGLRTMFRTMQRHWPTHKPPEPEVVQEVLDRPKYFAHRPFPKQQQFLDLGSHCEEVLFGGAAGGGKSDAILMAALQYVDVPGYSAIILRRDFPRLNLPGAIMDRAKSWLAGTAANWNKGEKTFYFPSGAKLQFGYIDNVQDRFRYNSSEFDFIGWDELTEIDLRSEDDETNPYLYMFSRLRRTKEKRIPQRVCGATNPGQVGHMFVKNYFIRDAEMDEHGVYWKEAEIDVKGHRIKTKRAFLPSLMKDNYALDEWEYTAKLARLPKVTRERLLAGNWDIQEGTLIDISKFGRYETVETSNTTLLYPLTNGLRSGHVDGRLPTRYAVIDTAGSSQQKEAESKGKAASYSVIQIYDSFEEKLFLREVVRGRFEWLALVARTIEALRRWKVPRTYIENATVGVALAAELQKAGLSCELIGPTLPDMVPGLNAKYERAVAGKLFETVENGNFYVPAERSAWLDAFTGEIGSWTGRVNETADQIDTASYGCHIHHTGAQAGWAQV